MKKTFKRISLPIAVFVLSLLFPFNTFAAAIVSAPQSSTNSSAGPITSFQDLAKRLLDMINLVIPFIISLALLYFLINIFKLVFASDDSKGREDAKGLIIWGIVTLFVMVSVWGLVRILTSTFFGNSFIVPQLR